MRIGIILSKKIEEMFKLKIRHVLFMNNIPFIEIEKLPHYLTDEDLRCFDYEYFIVIGIHSLSDKPKQLSVHPIGNWGNKLPFPLFGENGLGGEERKLSMASGQLLKQVFLSLIKHNTTDYEVNIEASHHGPLLKRPLVFLEIGSNKDAWSDLEANRVIAEVLNDICTSFNPKDSGASVVLGGDHYMTKVKELLEKSDLIVSHMCPSSQINDFTDDMLKEAIKKSYEKVGNVIIDVAGVGQHYEMIVKILESNKIPYVHLHDI